MTKNEISTVFDSELRDIVHYCYGTHDFSKIIIEKAQIAFNDATACAVLSLQNNLCLKHLGPIVPGGELTNGSRVPGTLYELDPVQAAYNITCMIRWLDYNDTWLAKEWGHPSDNLGAILACADYYSRNNTIKSYTMSDVLIALIKAYEIQGILALENSFNELGFDHVILVRIASTALAVLLLGGNEHQMLNALSNAFSDGAALRVYRHGENTVQRKSWAAADASSRAVKHALWAINNEPGCATVLSAKTWGFNEVILNNKKLIINQPYQHYVIENILYKISYPVEFHAQTAVECALKLHPIFSKHYNSDITVISKIDIFTQSAAMKIINKPGILKNAADRDHCLQYAVSVALLLGKLETEHYHNNFALEKHMQTKIKSLTEKINLIEDIQYTKDYYDSNKRAIANRINIVFNDGESFLEEVVYPLGHQQRRIEAEPLLTKKFESAITKHYGSEQTQVILNLHLNHENFLNTNVTDWMMLMKLNN